MRHELTSLRLEPRPLGWEAVCACGWSTRYRSRRRVIARWHDHVVEMTAAPPVPESPRPPPQEPPQPGMPTMNLLADARRPALGPDGGTGE